MSYGLDLNRSIGFANKNGVWKTHQFDVANFRLVLNRVAVWGFADPV